MVWIADFIVLIPVSFPSSRATVSLPDAAGPWMKMSCTQLQFLPKSSSVRSNASYPLVNNFYEKTLSKTENISPPSEGGEGVQRS